MSRFAFLSQLTLLLALPVLVPATAWGITIGVAPATIVLPIGHPLVGHAEVTLAGVSRQAPFLASQPIVIQTSAFDIVFDDVLPQVTLSELTLAIESLHAVASVQITPTRTIDVTTSLHFTPAALTWTAHTQGYLLDPNGDIRIPLPATDDPSLPPISAGQNEISIEEVVLETLIGNQSRSTDDPFVLDLTLAGGTVPTISSFSFGGASIGPITGVDPLTGEEISITSSGPLAINGVGVIPEPSTAALLALGLTGLAVRRRHRN